jgi:hypothetical protein
VTNSPCYHISSHGERRNAAVPQVLIHWFLKTKQLGNWKKKNLLSTADFLHHASAPLPCGIGGYRLCIKLQPVLDLEPVVGKFSNSSPSKCSTKSRSKLHRNFFSVFYPSSLPVVGKFSKSSPSKCSTKSRSKLRRNFFSVFYPSLFCISSRIYTTNWLVYDIHWNGPLCYKLLDFLHKRVVFTEVSWCFLVISAQFANRVIQPSSFR